MLDFNLLPLLQHFAKAMPVAEFDPLDPFKYFTFPFQSWVDQFLGWVVINFRNVFQTIKQPVSLTLDMIQGGLQSIPPMVGVVAFGVLGWQIGGPRVARTSVICLMLIGLFGIWSEAMTTLAIVLTSVIFCLLVGIPTGILAARWGRFAFLLRPALDLMQTIPSFVYLVPIVMLFGIGNVPGVIVTIIYALPPVVRLTDLGIRQVRADQVEAGKAFGASSAQILFKIQLPLAMPTIMAGVNQTIMMALAMSVVASMIAVTGLGQMVLRGIGRLDMGLATISGLGIVLLAITIDRISQGFGIPFRDWGHRKWYERGPTGLVVRAYGLARGNASTVRDGWRIDVPARNAKRGMGRATENERQGPLPNRDGPQGHDIA
jgi:glycine betaine/proline transport system permease protein